jgi:hypothetical protein
MQMIDVIKKLAELDAQGGLKESTAMVNDPALAMISEGQDLSECGPMGMPGMPGQTPASFSINASAASGDEVASMLTQIMTLAGMKEVGVKDINPAEPGHTLTGEPPAHGGDDIKQALAAIDQASNPMNDMNPEDEDMSDGDAVPGEMDTAGEMGQTGDVSGMADQVRDMADELSGTSKDELGLESLRQFDNSPQEHTREYNPNDFANIINKVRSFEVTPARGGDNPLKQESIEQAPVQKETSLLDITNSLMQEYSAYKNQ